MLLDGPIRAPERQVLWSVYDLEAVMSETLKLQRLRCIKTADGAGMKPGAAPSQVKELSET